MRNILLGVSGGIAAYKSCELVREFQRRGWTVQVILTKSAQEFVTKLTFESLTQRQVHTDLFGDGSFGTAHIDVARWADTFVIAPLTANTLGNFVTGLAPDFLSTVFLAFKGPVFVAPAMNTLMWEHEAVQANLKTLRDRKVSVIEPQSGELACGEVGVGKMAEPLTIAEQVLTSFSSSQTLKGKRVVITAGSTREYFDPVRFLSNPSTGKMGLEVGREASNLGAEVVLIHGPWNETIDFPAKEVQVTSADEMMKAVQSELPANYFIGTAAVSDYRAKTVSNEKLKKQSEWKPELIKNEDILLWAAKKKRKEDSVVGFAAETENLIPNAKLKLEEKGFDLVVANLVHRESQGFVQNQTSVAFVGKKGVIQELKNISKKEVARALWNHLERTHAKN